MARYGGWTGKTLRVNLTTGKISSEDTIAKYKEFLGGTGIGYKVLFDEVPVGTKAFDPENKIVFGVGPLTGSGATCSGRVSITAIWPVGDPDTMVGTGHMGGHWGPELKFAGWDSVIIEGKADHPVWLSIMDDKVEICDARQLWGNGIYRATAEICGQMGAGAQVAAIGQAGENLVRLSVVMNSYSHSAGGVGCVMGSKNLKAIGVIGTGGVVINSDKKAWKDLNKYVLSIIGSNNQAVVPNSPQPWAEYWSSGTRWTAKKGLYWGAASPPVETGLCEPHDMNSIGYRCQKAVFDFGPLAEGFTVRMGGCHSCPIRCHSQLDVPSVEEKYGYSRYAANTCVGWSGPGGVMGSFPDGSRGMTSIEAKVLGKHLVDDLGVWCNYGSIGREFKYAYEKGLIKKYVPEAEYKTIPFDLWEKGDPAFLIDFYKRIAFRQGEFGEAMGEGTARLAKRWGFGADYFTEYKYNHWKMGHPKHHSNETNGQVGAIINTQYNRDSQCHSHINLVTNGLPLAIQKKIAEKLFGSGDAVDAPNNYTRMNRSKAVFAKWSLLRKELHDCLTMCNWMFPLSGSPLKERGYMGDDAVEALYYSAVTGDIKTKEELDMAAERVFNLHRVLTMLEMGTADMRNKHDLIPDWVFNYPEGKVPFTAGHTKLEREDMKLAMTMFYEECGWDKETGAPTRATLERLGLKDAADRLAAAGLLPA